MHKGSTPVGGGKPGIPVLQYLLDKRATYTMVDQGSRIKYNLAVPHILLNVH